MPHKAQQWMGGAVFFACPRVVVAMVGSLVVEHRPCNSFGVVNVRADGAVVARSGIAPRTCCFSGYVKGVVWYAIRSSSVSGFWRFS
eukprot:2169081-Pyramimonas_sp.AAC.1